MHYTNSGSARGVEKQGRAVKSEIAQKNTCNNGDSAASTKLLNRNHLSGTTIENVAAGSHLELFDNIYSHYDNHLVLAKLLDEIISEPDNRVDTQSSIHQL